MRIWGLVVVAMAVTVASLLGTGGASAQNAAASVKERQDAMKSYFPNYLRGFSQVARGESTDISTIPAKASEAAADFRKIPSLFPAGTGREAAPETRAKPEVWSNRAEFEARANRLAAEADKLSEVAKGGNLDAVKAQIAAVGQACGTCHGGPARSGGDFRTEAPQ